MFINLFVLILNGIVSSVTKSATDDGVITAQILPRSLAAFGRSSSLEGSAESSVAAELAICPSLAM